MGRAPCCDKANVKKGPWSPEEDMKLKEFIEKHGTGGNWIALPHKAGLKRCGKSCRLRWLNYLRPNIKHGEFSDEEDRIICGLFASIGSRWSIIASHLPGRTDNDIKNYWNTKLKKKLLGIHPSQRKPQHQQQHDHQHRNPLLFSSSSSSSSSSMATKNPLLTGSDGFLTVSQDMILSSLSTTTDSTLMHVQISPHDQYQMITADDHNSGMIMFGSGDHQSCNQTISYGCGDAMRSGELMGFENYYYSGVDQLVENGEGGGVQVENNSLGYNCEDQIKQLLSFNSGCNINNYDNTLYLDGSTTNNGWRDQSLIKSDRGRIDMYNFRR